MKRRGLVGEATATAFPGWREARPAAPALRLPRWGVGTQAAGWLRVLVTVAVSAQGLWLVALGFAAARDDRAWSEPAFWAGLLLIYLPVAGALMALELGRGQALALVTSLGAILYVVKYMHSPLGFTYYDELLHWRTTLDILASGRLFQENSMLPASPLYPALEICTSALVMLTHLSVFEAGLILVGVARMILLVAAFLFLERAGRSVRVAALAVVVYMSNPHFLYFDAQFAYESLALPYVALIVFVLLLRERARAAIRLGLTGIVILATGLVVAAHHVTSIFLTGFLSAWSFMTTFALRARAKRGPGGLGLLALVAVLGWMVFVAYVTVDYLKPLFIDGVVELFGIVAGQSTGRVLFQNKQGHISPLWERLVGTSSVAILVLALPFGLFLIWRRSRCYPAIWSLALIALVYPTTVLLRLTPSGADVASRATAFLYLGLSFPISLVLARLSASARLRPLLLSTLAIVFVGGIVLGWPPWARLPWPYAPNADTRSVDLAGVSASSWTQRYLGPGQRFIADRWNRILLLAYGDQRIVTQLSGRVSIFPIFLSRRVGDAELSVLQRGDVRYMLLDYRLITGEPMGDVYEGSEQMGALRVAPIDRASFEKFDTLPGVDRVYDNGSIVIIDVGRLTRGR